MAMIVAHFQGGPLDGTSKRVPDGPVYRYTEQRRGRYDGSGPGQAGQGAVHVYRREGAFTFIYRRAEDDDTS